LQNKFCLHTVGHVVRDDVDFILADAGTLDANKAMQAFAIFKLFVVYVHLSSTKTALTSDCCFQSNAFCSVQASPNLFYDPKAA
jgi:hypothetical protein